MGKTLRGRQASATSRLFSTGRCIIQPRSTNINEGFLPSAVCCSGSSWNQHPTLLFLSGSLGRGGAAAAAHSDDAPASRTDFFLCSPQRRHKRGSKRLHSNHDGALISRLSLAVFRLNCFQTSSFYKECHLRTVCTQPEEDNFESWLVKDVQQNVILSFSKDNCDFMRGFLLLFSLTDKRTIGGQKSGLGLLKKKNHNINVCKMNLYTSWLPHGGSLLTGTLLKAACSLQKAAPTALTNCLSSNSGGWRHSDQGEEERSRTDSRLHQVKTSTEACEWL